MPRTPLVVVLLVLFLAPPAAASTTFIPPVDAPLVRRFEPPEAAWGPGHRGVDFALPPGTAIRAPADGTVVFAGSVAGLRVVTLSHGDGLETTYSFLSDVTVEEGLRVSQGHWVGRSGETHPGGSPGLHWGAKLGGAYVDPTTYLVEMDLSDAIRLERIDPSNEDGGGETDPRCTARR
ncbi:MAG TPA: M23 family metallopeptidase, partial [Actinomycetota bacterium]|nr:M23 family metallopeptidase [Actinomycetota bacterium]